MHRSAEGATAGSESLRLLLEGDKSAVAQALASVEQSPFAAATVQLLDACYVRPRAHVVGITGPPGVGKSTLIGVLIKHLRKCGKTVAVIAVDPSSRRSGGALLGDRVRLSADGEDAGVFIRSMAARDRLGGLAEHTVAAMVVLRAIYDFVMIETVGVGQSETDVSVASDTVVFCVQPGSGDSLQFMKAGITEISHLLVITKADVGKAAERTAADVRVTFALSSPREDGWLVEPLILSARQGSGIGELVSRLEWHASWLRQGGRIEKVRHAQAEACLIGAARTRFGTEGLKTLVPLRLDPGESPFGKLARFSRQPPPEQQGRG